MNEIYVAYLIAFGVSALVCVGTAVRARLVPDPDVRRSLVVLLLTCGGWAGAYVGVFLASTEGVARGFHLIGLIVGAGAVVAWLWFCSAYSGRDLHRDRSVQRWALILFGVVVLTKLTNPWHGLHFTTAQAASPFPHLAIDYHVLYWGSAGLAYALSAIGFFMLFELFRKVGSSGGALKPLATLMALPVLLNGVGYASPSLLNISHEPLGVAAFAVGVFYFYGKEFERVHFAGEWDDPVLVLGEDGRLREYNQSARELLPEKFQGHEALGRPVGDLLPELGDVLEKGDSLVQFGEATDVRSYEIARRFPGDDGRREGHFLVLTDVTEYKWREQALEQESAALRKMSRVTADPDAPFEEKIARLLELGRDYLGLPYGFLTEITEGTQIIVNASGGHPLLQDGETCPLSEAYCRKTIRGERLLAIQNAVEAGWEGDPAYETFELGSYIGSKVIAHGDLYGTFCFAATEPRARPFNAREKAFVDLLTRWTSYEIERRQDKEQLKRQNDRLEEFTSVLTHDLRNPLNVAQGRLSLALEESGVVGKRDGSDGTLSDHLQGASHALGRMERLIEDMLALTWGEQALGTEDMESVSLQEMVEACWQQVEGPEATLRGEDDLSILAHRGRLQQLLENLFRNAVEHGGSDVTVTVGALSTEEPQNGFYVEDDGPGIPEEKREKVFERGYSSEEQGTGLGLSITRAIAEAHGWSITVFEGRTGGARFEIRNVDGSSK